MQQIAATARPAGEGERQQLSAAVAAYLRERIVSGKLRAGEYLRANAIAGELGVSATPVREGLLLLASEALVQRVPRHGFMVGSFTREDLRDIFWTQATIGAELAARAVKYMSDSELVQLQGINVRHEQALAERDEVMLARLGHEFHRSINLAARSPRLASVMGSLTKQLPNRFYASIEGHGAGAVAYHPLITQAIRVGDAQAVHALMFRHIASGAEHLITAFERQGLWA
ncbi:transcriptional regulator, GntR family [Acidovorax delafieldii 2AN]|uniref:Transcriptional regulator, GntR family n=1 Tax=Acidovorax delafieldii 2AN TaxID=573060 RepID=C5T151_ACIDE|nr:GntR family transcriptional regulator [Acidovorax delafieldii]EER61795.1 transcriptional regulator, GntR family [Acidovorax delafieldii 2AN]